uniref:TIGR01897 family CRISPR-associated protein n=1 Tax=Archaeoglobus fulgidus TaxID=2234 RepID=A0A7C3MCI4_ARCFL
MIRIFQVAGRPENYDEKEFVLNGKSYRTILCSDALRKHLEKEGKIARLTILVPESLLVDLNEFSEKLRERGLDDFDAAIIPSIGKFGQIEFRGSIETINTAIFLQLIKNKPDEFYIDVSTGFNIYTVSLLEVAKRYITFRKLEGLLQGKDEIRAYALFTPPVMKNVDRYFAEIQPIDARAFFSLPDANIDRIAFGEQRDRLAELNRSGTEIKRRFRKMYEELKLAYNSMRLNVPLAFYELLDFSDTVKEDEITEFIEKFLEPVKTGDAVERLNVDGVNVANIFYAVALHRSFKEFADSLSEPDVDEIWEKFSRLYRVKNLGIGINEYFLQRDLDEIREMGKKLGENEEEILGKLKHGENFTESANRKRNFFAHSGFLYEWTILRKNEGRILLCWIGDGKKEIINWLLEPERN